MTMDDQGSTAMIRKVFTKTKTSRCVRCPSCEKGEFDISHLRAGETAGPWYCDDCGAAAKFEVVSETLVKVEPTGDKKIVTDVHLVLDDPKQLPLTLIVTGSAFGKVGQADDGILAGRGDRYFYEEHTCVSNYLRAVKKVVAADGDEDRHGIFRWEKTVLESDKKEDTDG